LFAASFAVQDPITPTGRCALPRPQRMPHGAANTAAQNAINLTLWRPSGGRRPHLRRPNWPDTRVPGAE